MTEKHFIGTISQKVIIKCSDKIVIERHRGIWHLPGGRLNLGERLEDGVKREIKEELGIETEPRLFKAVTFVNRYKDQKFSLIYTVELSSLPELTIQADEIDEIKWITKDELADISMYDEFKNAIREYFQKSEA